MSNIPITSLPIALSLTGSEAVPIVQAGTTKQTTVGAIANTASGFVPVTRVIQTLPTGGLAGGGALSSDLSLSFYPFGLVSKSAMVTADTFAINDSVATEPKQVTFPNAMKALTGLSALALPSATNDYLIINRAADGLTYKINPSSLSLGTGNLPAGGTVGQPLVKDSSTDFDASWQTLPVIGGGTGAITLTDHGVLLGQGASAVVATASMSGGQLLIGQTGADPAPTTVTGDVTISNLGVTAIGANKVTDAMLRQSSGLSVIGRSASTTGNVADITGTADQVLRVAGAGASLGFGSIDLSKSAAVGASILGIANGGTNIASYTLGDTLYASGATTLSKLSGNTTAAIQYLSQTGTGAASAAPVWATISGGDITGAALTKVDDTNVTLTLGGSPTTALLRATSITAGWTGQLSLARGGTNANLTASNGGIFYSTASAGAILSGTATARQMLQSGATAAPAWSTSTWPATTTANRLLYSSATNVVGEITTGSNGVLASPSGVPTWTATPTFGTSGSVLGSLTLAGNTSGAVTITPQAAAGTATFTLPNASGTPAISVPSPLSLSATTGAATWTGLTSGGVLYASSTTAVSSSALLAANQIVLGGGAGTAPATLGSNGTTNQILQAVTSGAPVWSTATYPATTTANQLLYSSATNTVTGLATGSNGILASPGGVPGWSATPTLGTAGSVAGSIAFANATSGSITLQPSTGALGSSVLTLPIATDTLIGKATTDTLTNKTYDTAGTGNVFKINGTTVNAVTGTGSTAVLSTSPTLTTPTIGVATATSVNKVAITAPATSATLTIQDGKTLSYSEGTWTPAVSTLTTPGTPAYTTQVGFYVKIGTMVYANFSIVLSGWTGSPSGGVTITSLPFTTSATANNFGSCTLFFYSVAGLAASNFGMTGSVQPSSTTVALLSNGSTTTSNVTAAQAGTTPQFFGYVIYRTDS